jgi:hypothetical protein
MHSVEDAARHHSIKHRAVQNTSPSRMMIDTYQIYPKRTQNAPQQASSCPHWSFRRQGGNLGFVQKLCNMISSELNISPTTRTGERQTAEARLFRQTKVKNNELVGSEKGRAIQCTCSPCDRGVASFQQGTFEHDANNCKQRQQRGDRARENKKSTHRDKQRNSRVNFVLQYSRNSRSPAARPSSGLALLAAQSTSRAAKHTARFQFSMANNLDSKYVALSPHQFLFSCLQRVAGGTASFIVLPDKAASRADFA